MLGIRALKKEALLALLLAGLALGGCRAGTAGAPENGTAAPARLAFTPDGSVIEVEEGKKPGLIANPTIADLMKAGPLGDRSLGRADAPVTVIEYASLTCPFCKAFHERTYPEFKRRYIDTGKVRFILREFPIGRSSGNAWLVTRCAPGDKFFTLYELYLKKQHYWVSQEVRIDRIFEVAKSVGMTRAEFDKCLANQKIINAIKWVKQRGRQLGVTGTPTFFINGRKERSVLTIEQLAAIIDPMIAARAAASGGS